MNSLISPVSDDEMLLSKLKAGKSLVPERQLDIYRRNLNGAHQKVLQTIYPACHAILGEQYFSQLSRVYRFQYPSLHPDLNWYGKEFPAFLDNHVAMSDMMHEYAYLCDLAELEWCWHAAYYASDDSPFDFEGLQSLNADMQERIVFQVSNSLSLHVSPYPVIDIWRSNRGEPDGHQQFEHDGSAIHYCIYRRDYESRVLSIDINIFSILSAIISGQAMSAITDTFGDKVGACLPGLIQDGWICGYAVADK